MKISFLTKSKNKTKINSHRITYVTFEKYFNIKPYNRIINSIYKLRGNYLRINNQKSIGIFWVILSMGFFSISMCISKFISPEIPTFVKVFIRLFFGLLILFPLTSQNIKTFKTNNLIFYLLRAILVSGSMVCAYYTYFHLPIALATSIGFTTPIITTALSILFLKEKVNSIQWFIVLIGYLGVLIMVRPVILDFTCIALIGLFGNFLTSCAILIANQISKKDLVNKILFYTSFLSFILMLGPGIYFWESPNNVEILLLSCLSVTGLLSQYCYLRAIRYAKVSVLAPFEYVRLIFSISFGFLLFNEIPHIYTLLGITLIIIADLLLYQDITRKRISENRV